MRSTAATRHIASRGIAVSASAAHVHGPPGPGASSESVDEPPTESPVVGVALSEVPLTEVPAADASLFGASLEPILRKQLEGRLSGVSWFRTDWQRGGALTGFATYRDEDDGDREHDVVVKMPVPPRERDWLGRCHDHPKRDAAVAVTPHLYAHGDTLNGYDLAWVVMEKLPYGPLNPTTRDWGAAAFDLLLDAAADFHFTAHHTQISDEEHARRDAQANDWPALFAKAREQVKGKSFPNGQAWKKALKQHAKEFESLCEAWAQRPTTGWCHGDLHPGNALHMPGDGEHPDRCVLIDLGLVHRGSWVEDAVYLEHLFWGHEDRLSGVEPVKAMRAERKRRGLRVRERDGRLANIKRVLTAACVPARLAGEGGDQAYLHAALDRLEKLLPTL